MTRLATVLHFAVGDVAHAACGARLYLCSDSTDRPNNVDCGRCRRTRRFRDFDPTLYDVDVWNHEGDVIHYRHAVSSDEVEEVRQQYGDDPALDVVVEESRHQGSALR